MLSAHCVPGTVLSKALSHFYTYNNLVFINSCHVVGPKDLHVDKLLSSCFMRKAHQSPCKCLREGFWYEAQ